MDVHVVRNLRLLPFAGLLRQLLRLPDQSLLLLLDLLGGAPLPLRGRPEVLELPLEPVLVFAADAKRFEVTRLQLQERGPSDGLLQEARNVPLEAQAQQPLAHLNHHTEKTTVIRRPSETGYSWNKTARRKTAFFSVAAKENIIRQIYVLVGGNCRFDFRLQFPPFKTRIGRIIKFFVATDKKAVLRRVAT